MFHWHSFDFLGFIVFHWHWLRSLPGKPLSGLEPLAPNVFFRFGVPLHCHCEVLNFLHIVLTQSGGLDICQQYGSSDSSTTISSTSSYSADA